MWNGMSRKDGTGMAGLDHLSQSVRDILTTRRGTRVMRRDYGVEHALAIDDPLNRETLVLAIADAADALDRWEPRFTATEFVIDDIDPGVLTLGGIRGLFYPDWPDRGRAVEVLL
jgi:phage baseplate assembly protein W